MAAGLDEQRVSCPYCGEAMHVVLDTSAGGQCYIEDCQVCCQPMQVEFTTAADGSIGWLEVRRAD